MAAFIWPFDPAIYESSPYGPRTGGAGSFHEGIDLAPAYGTDIPMSGDGIVVENYYHSNFGNMILVFHGTFTGVGSTIPNDLYTLYPHMISASPFGVGATVTQGTTVGQVGTSGLSFGAHLHWETHECAVGGGIVHNLTDDGGYRTAINPYDFMAKYSDGSGGGGPDPIGRRRIRSRSWQQRPPGIYYGNW